jgi:hypothetical protein
MNRLTADGSRTRIPIMEPRTVHTVVEWTPTLMDFTAVSAPTTADKYRATAQSLL